MLAKRSLEEIIGIVSGLLNIKKVLDQQTDHCSGHEDARKLAVKYWSLISSIDECIIGVDNYNRETETKTKLTYSKLLSESIETSEAGKKRVAENNTEYILMQDELRKGELYRNYLRNVREDIFAGHYIMKSIFEREVDIFIASPKTEG
jgi:hypothetical protein